MFDFRLVDLAYCLAPAGTYERTSAKLARTYLANSGREIAPVIEAGHLQKVRGGEREGTLSDRKTGMRGKRVIDHEIPSLASSLSQG